MSRWNADGSYAWTRHTELYQEAWGSFDLDADGDVLVAGSFTYPQVLDPRTKALTRTPPDGPSDLFVQSWSGVDGSFRWSEVLGGAGGEVGPLIRDGQDGDYSVAGQFAGTTDLDPSAAVLVFTSAGKGDRFVATLTDGGEVAPFCPYDDLPSEPDPGTCRLTCECVGASCGIVPDGCGAEMNCGMCVAPFACGAARANVCGAVKVLADASA